MAKTLLIGASSTIAKSLQEFSNKEIFNFSRSEGNLDLDGDLSELDEVTDMVLCISWHYKFKAFYYAQRR